MLQFCNVSVRLTPDTLSHVNNESDDPRTLEIEGTRWHMAKRMRHADSLTYCPHLFFALNISTALLFPPLLHLLLLLLSAIQTLIFNLLIRQWPQLSRVHLSITRPSWIPQRRRRGTRWGKSGVDELNRRCSEEGGECWTSGCSPQLSAGLLSDLEEIRKLGDPQPLWSNSHCKKKKTPPPSFMNYWDIGLQPLKYTGGWSVSPFGFPILSTTSLSLSFCHSLLSLSLFLPYSDLASCATQDRKRGIQTKGGEKKKTKQKMSSPGQTVCYSDHPRLSFLHFKTSVYH